MRDADNFNEQDRNDLARDLAAALEGEVRFSTGDIALYANDASNYRQPPIGVVIPKTIDDIIATHRICRAYGAPILSRGGGTSLSGETVNHAVVMDHSKYLDHIIDIDPIQRQVTVETGVINDKLNETLGPFGLVFPPDPSTHKWCTIGGNIGNNSCGIHSVQAQFYGHGPRTADNVRALDVLTYDGTRMTLKDHYEESEIDEIIAAGGTQGRIFESLKALRDRYADEIRARFPRIEKLPRRVSGYNLDDLLPENGFNLASALCGTEGTCVTVLHVTFKLTEQVKHRTLMVIGFEDIATAADHVPTIMQHRPIALEGIDEQLFEDEQQEHMHPKELSQLPKGHGWLLVEFGGDNQDESDAKADTLIEDLKRTKSAPTGYSIIDDKEQEGKLWAVREAGLGATAFPPDGRDHWPGWEDSAVPPERVGDYLRDLHKLYAKYDYRGALYGHLGQGCVHSRISFGLHTGDGVKKFRAFMEEAGDLVVSYGGSLSGEHGDGQARAELLVKMFGEQIMQAFREFKRIWDPEWKMNPGKVIDPYKLDENLRLVNYRPWQTPTEFRFPHDQRNFGRVAMRCVGVGKCRATEGGTMCPSYMVTHEEKHATRGRARLLFEMMDGGVLKDGWRSEAVKDALNLCLSCKGCKNDCPVHVDMASYKAEFLSHYFEGRAKPIQAYAFGLIDRWSRLASKMPALVNFLTNTPGLSNIAKELTKMPQQRTIPKYAPQTFKSWFRKRGVHNADGPPVVLWADTFNNHFFPDIAQAGVEVLESLGYRVLVPQGHVCCGRPLYEFGMLDLARQYLRDVMDALENEIAAEVPIVGLEPSCISVFRDELTNMFPDDEWAQRLSKQSLTLSEFLEQKVENYTPPRLKRKALVHIHCHHKSVLDHTSEKKLLDKMGLDVDLLSDGCCGMAGSFGFEKEKYDVSIGAGERVLLPKVRNASDDTLIIANGFSCREQIAQTTDRRALHVAQVIQMAMHDEAQQHRPEAPVERRRAAAQHKANRKAAMITGALVAGGLLAWTAGRRR
ncbi:MAG TPA: FAD-binding and (Fe-S)-binding domain-containing protein [Gammaproteobacteria bacterium]|nr:FAD-binding and (Fe-S)-binding domain-containing protein [Gammaproteobacteria bacterium]